MTCPCREEAAKVADGFMKEASDTDFGRGLGYSALVIGKRIRALPCSCDTVRVPRELRELLDTVSALDTFSAENPRDFSRMPSYLQVIHKRLFKEWGAVRALLTTQSADTVRVPREDVEGALANVRQFTNDLRESFPDAYEAFQELEALLTTKEPT